MALDPAIEAAMQANRDPVARLTLRLSSLEQRIAGLESGAPVIQVQTGVPSGTARDGTPVLASGTPRLYLRVGGVWRYTALT